MELSSTGVYKSAVLLASLGAEAAARVLSHLDEAHVEALVREMARLEDVPADERDRVVGEFHTRLQRGRDGAVGGLEYARRVLEEALGPERAGRMLTEIASGDAGPTLASMLESTSPESLAALMADEHPQLIALLIGQLPVEQAAVFVSSLPSDVQVPVTARLAEMETPAPIAVQTLQRCLMEKLRNVQRAVAEEGSGGPRRVAEILGRMRRSAESALLSTLEQEAPAVAEKVAQFRFSFEDLLQLEARVLQRVLRDVESDTLRLAMKGLDEERQQVIFSNMSERAAARLREELEVTGPTRLRDVEAAQQAMVAVARRLQETGEVQFTIGAPAEGEGEEEVYV